MPAYDIFGKHNSKQTVAVTPYIDKFEELIGLVRRNNPSLPYE
jgi:hypothetical protein